MENQENVKDWSEQTIANRYMFYKVFSSNPDACRNLLEILLNIKIVKIEYPLGEKDFEADIDAHAIRVDIYTEDDNHVYDIEMQTTYETDLPERSRYYQALMDVDKLKAGQFYGDLKDSIVIFICTFDPFDEAKPKYEFRNLDVENGKTELGDRTKKIFFNVNEYDKIKNDEELKNLLEYFSSSKAGSAFTNSLDKLVDVARHNAQWRQSFMTTERLQNYARREGMRQGIARQKAEDEKLLAAERQQNAKQAARIAELEALLAQKQQGK